MLSRKCDRLFGSIPITMDGVDYKNPGFIESFCVIKILASL